MRLSLLPIARVLLGVVLGAGAVVEFTRDNTTSGIWLAVLCVATLGTLRTPGWSSRIAAQGDFNQALAYKALFFAFGCALLGAALLLGIALPRSGARGALALLAAVGFAGLAAWFLSESRQARTKQKGEKKAANSPSDKRTNQPD